ncbi:MAG TPA: rhodanese-like domain-containing protein [Leucothrix sp.]|nr:rhodanese-like domain-containing protein [Leucothrix sp.]
MLGISNMFFLTRKLYTTSLLNLGEHFMKYKIFYITLPSILLGIFLSVTGCNAKTSSQADTQTTKAADPIPQAGGYSNIDNAKLQELLDQSVTLVDIRLEEEWQQTGIVKGAKTITFFDRTGRINPAFVPEFTKLVKKDQPVALICRTGRRTQAASQAIAQQLGYKKVYNVTHGILGWISEKRPVVKY